MILQNTLKAIIMKFFSPILFAIFCQLSLSLTAQEGLETNPMVLLVKANGLYEQARYDEAIRMYNIILNDNEKYAPALIMRAKTKYELGAFKGVKMDCEKYIGFNGVNKEIIKLMSRTEIKLANFESARNYVITALELDPYDPEMHFVKGQVELEIGSKNDACEAFYLAYQLGWEPGRMALSEYCKSFVPPNPPTLPTTKVETPAVEIKSEKSLEDSLANDSIKEDSVLGSIIRITEKDNKVITPQEETANIEESKDHETSTVNTVESPPAQIVIIDPAYLNATQSITIDDELSVILTYGLGQRTVLQHPDILMVNNESGRVVLDICVDKSGKVVTTAFNGEESTLIKSALTSLSMRKAREFSFAPSSVERECGRIIFRIEVEKR